MKIKIKMSLLRGLACITIITSSLLWSGCGEAGGPDQKVGDYAMSLRVRPDPPIVGLNTFRIKVLDASDSPVENATIHIHYSMSAMAGMPAMADEAETQHIGNGLYEVQIDLSSGGKFPWDFRIEVAQDQTILAVAQWQVIPETRGIKYVSGENGGAGEGEIDYYTCTMHPSVKDKEPGKCPICAMDLVPIFKEGAEQQTGAADKQVRTVNISLYQQQLIGVQRDTVKLRSVAQTIRTIGHVAYDETRIATVNLKFSGWIEKLYVDYTGQLVKKGQSLFDIYSPELVSTQEEYLQALRNPSFKLRSNGSNNRPGDGAGNRESSLLKSSRDRLLLWGISEEQIAELEKTRTPNLELTVYSPIGGYVLEKNTLQGRHAKAGTDLYTIADLSTIWVHADIYEYELPLIEVGQKATIKMAYEPGAEYTGRVDYIYPTLQARTRTAKVRLIFPNPDLKLKPDMYVDVEIAVDRGEQLAIPETAVLNTGVRQLVYVDRGKGRFEPREIRLGPKVGRYYVVLAGLEPEEVIVKSGNFLIDAEAHVQGVLQTMGN
jgi:multidrug efflux pump subunit AcrA (membrane-fusion protein)